MALGDDSTVHRPSSPPQVGIYALDLPAGAEAARFFIVSDDKAPDGQRQGVVEVEVSALRSPTAVSSRKYGTLSSGDVPEPSTDDAVAVPRSGSDGNAGGERAKLASRLQGGVEVDAGEVGTQP